MNADCDNEFVGNVQRLHKHVQMAVRHGIEGAGIKSGRHALGLGLFQQNFLRLLSWKRGIRKRLCLSEQEMNGPFKRVSQRVWSIGTVTETSVHTEGETKGMLAVVILSAVVLALAVEAIVVAYEADQA